jgi:hypothetical protein
MPLRAAYEAQLPYQPFSLYLPFQALPPYMA